MPLTRKQFAHVGLADVYFGSSGSGIPASQAGRCQRLLDSIAAATKPDDPDIPGNGYSHRAPRHSLDVSGSNKIVYEWRSGHAADINYV